MLYFYREFAGRRFQSNPGRQPVSNRFPHFHRPRANLAGLVTLTATDGGVMAAPLPRCRRGPGQAPGRRREIQPERESNQTAKPERSWKGHSIFMAIAGSLRGSLPNVKRIWPDLQSGGCRVGIAQPVLAAGPMLHQIRAASGTEKDLNDWFPFFPTMRPAAGRQSRLRFSHNPLAQSDRFGPIDPEPAKVTSA